jgi:hypothetical protein
MKMLKGFLDNHFTLLQYMKMSPYFVLCLSRSTIWILYRSFRVKKSISLKWKWEINYYHTVGTQLQTLKYDFWRHSGCSFLKISKLIYMKIILPIYLSPIRMWSSIVSYMFGYKTQIDQQHWGIITKNKHDIPRCKCSHVCISSLCNVDHGKWRIGVLWSSIKEFCKASVSFTFLSEINKWVE